MSNPVAKIDDLKEGNPIRVNHDGKEVALFKVEDSVYAISAQCPHRQGPLDDADLEDGFIAVCPWHGWRFDIRTGKSPTHPAQVSCYQVNIKNGEIYLSAK